MISDKKIKLSDAILAGCKLAPNKEKYVFFKEGNYSYACLLGAAALGSGFDPNGCLFEFIGNQTRLHLEKAFGLSLIDPWPNVVRDAVIENNVTDKSREEIAEELAKKGW